MKLKLKPGLRPGRRPLACYHEAGHAVARWWLGFHTDRVTVLSMAQVASGVTLINRRGVEVRAEGLCDGYDIHIPFASDMQIARRRAEMDMVCSFAGPLAEARYRKCSALTCLLFGGDLDLESVTAMAEGHFDEGEERSAAKTRAEKIASALVRSSMGWRAISALAKALYDKGEVNGDEVDAACSEVFGAGLTHDRWRDKWAPTTAVVRSGCLPDAIRPRHVASIQSSRGME